MPLLCELCGTALGPRDSACRVCGTQRGEAKSPAASEAATGAAASAPGGAIPDTFLVMPHAAAPDRRRQAFAWAVGGCGVAAAAAGVVCLTAFTLWRKGPVVQISYEQHNRAANAAFERGDFHTADAEYSAMITLQPRRVDGYLLRAINDHKMGLFPQAVRDNTDALALNPVPMQRANLFFNRAEAYMNRRAWDKAVADYTASEQAYRQASMEPNGYDQDQERLPRWMADVRHGRAHANLELKHYAQTIADYTANINAGTVRPEDYGVRATALAALGHDDRAAADYGRAISLDAGYMYGYQMLERMVDKSHHYEQAVSAYKQATQAHPESALCWGSLGWHEYQTGHLSAAIAADERALALDPAQNWCRYNLGLSCAVSGDGARASKAYAAALAGQDQGNRAGAFKEVQKALEEHPHSAALQGAVRQMQSAIAAAPPVSVSHAASLDTPRVDPAYESLLAADVTQPCYRLRPPAGFTLKQDKSVGLSDAHNVDLWQGPARPDGSAPDLQIEVITDDGRIAAAASPKQRMQEYLDAIATNHTLFKASAITSCAMGMRTFMKATWSGVGVKTGRQFNGFAYIASQSGEYISIVAHDTAPGSATSLPLLEASTRTFRR